MVIKIALGMALFLLAVSFMNLGMAMGAEDYEKALAKLFGAGLYFFISYALWTALP